MVENVLKENEKLEVLVNEIISPERNSPFIFIKPKNESEHFYAEVFLDNKCKEHFFNKTIPGRFIFLDDPILDGKKHLDIKYFKVKILNLK